MSQWSRYTDAEEIALLRVKENSGGGTTVHAYSFRHDDVDPTVDKPATNGTRSTLTDAPATVNADVDLCAIPREVLRVCP